MVKFPEKLIIAPPTPVLPFPAAWRFLKTQWVMLLFPVLYLPAPVLPIASGVFSAPSAKEFSKTKEAVFSKYRPPYLIENISKFAINPSWKNISKKIVHF